MEKKTSFYRVVRNGIEAKPYAKQDMGYKAVHLCDMDTMKNEGIALRNDNILPNGFVCYYMKFGDNWVAIEELTGTSVMTRLHLKTYKEAYAYVEEIKYSIMRIVADVSNKGAKSDYKTAYLYSKVIEDKKNGNK